MRPRVLLADDHRETAEQLRSLLQPDFDVVGMVEDGRALVNAAAQLTPDVIVTDISMPRLDGIDAAVLIRRDDPGARIVFVTVHSDSLLVERGLAAGGVGLRAEGCGRRRAGGGGPCGTGRPTFRQPRAGRPGNRGHQINAMPEHAILEEEQDFSLVLGGPLFQLFRRAHLAGDALELMTRRVLVISSVAWVPLLLLSAAAGQALGGGIRIPFLHDVETHVRFLIALPVLIVAERFVHERLRPVVAQFVKERIVRPEELPAFRQVIASILRARNSVIAEVAMLLVVYTFGLWGTQQQILAFPTASWYARPDLTQMHLTPAGYWSAFVSVPLFQFILLRWAFRFLLWFRFLWRVSRLNLRLLAIHPDRAAGLGFLSGSIGAFAPILFAQSALLSGVIASLVFYAGRDAMAFKVEVAAVLALFIAIVLSPLAVFVPQLARERRQALRSVASQFVDQFEEKGTQSSLTDLGNRYTAAWETQLLPFRWKDVLWLAAAAAVPFLPLALTSLSLEQLLDRAISVLL